MSPLIIAIGGAVLLVLFIAMFILSRINVAGPNEAFIVTGRKGKGGEAGLTLYQQPVHSLCQH